jgi:hypothetical protein
MSLHDLEQTQNIGGAGHPDHELMTPNTPDEPPRTEYGNPNKIAQFFPELTLTQ